MNRVSETETTLEFNDLINVMGILKFNLIDNVLYHKSTKKTILVIRGYLGKPISLIINRKFSRF